MKNRFSTLCKKRARYEALAEENSTSYINSNNKRLTFQQDHNTDTTSESAILEKMRYGNLDIKIHNFYEKEC